MAHEYIRKRRVEFAETDTAGIVHFSCFYRYMEETEHEFLRSLGLSVHPLGDDGYTLGFPRLSARCEFLGPLKFEDEFEIHLRVARKGRSSLTYQFDMRLVLKESVGGGSPDGSPGDGKSEDASSEDGCSAGSILAGSSVARGEVSVICCRFRRGATFEKIELPAEYRSRIEESSATPLRFREPGGGKE